jgi:hypothetical protein
MSNEPNIELPTYIEQARTPKVWVDLFLDRHGLKLSCRSINSIARQTGNFIAAGKGIVMTAEHLDAVLEEMTCRSKRTKEKTRIAGTQEDMSKSTDVKLGVTSEKALAHLQNKER